MYQGGRPQIYNAQEVKKIKDVGQIIPRIDVEFDNKEVDHHASIIEMEGKLCDPFISIFIEPVSNYIYVNPNLVDKCGFRNEVYAESWLVNFPIVTKKRVHNWVRACAFEFNCMPTST